MWVKAGKATAGQFGEKLWARHAGGKITLMLPALTLMILILVAGITRTPAQDGQDPPPDASQPTPAKEASAEPLELDDETVPPPIEPAILNQPVSYVAHRRFRLGFIANDRGGSGLKQVELWVTRDAGKTFWRYATADQTGAAPIFEFRAPEDGTYGFVLRAVDHAGNVETKPDRVERVVVVDSKPPQLALLSPTPQDLLLAGEPVRIEWIALDETLPRHGITLRVGTDPEGPLTLWEEATENDGGYELLIPKKASALVVEITATDLANNRTTVRRVFRNLIGGDSRPIMAPPPHSRIRDIEVPYRFRNIDVSLISEVRLYTTLDGGQTWSARSQRFLPGSSIRFKPADDGNYGLYLVAIFPSGAWSAPPPVGGRSKSHGQVLVDTKPPELQVLAPAQNARLTPGEPTVVRFTLHDAVDPRPGDLHLELSADNGRRWRAIPIKKFRESETGGANALEMDWTTPKIIAPNLQLRLSASDEVGHTGHSNVITVKIGS